MKKYLFRNVLNLGSKLVINTNRNNFATDGSYNLFEKFRKLTPGTCESGAVKVGNYKESEAAVYFKALDRGNEYGRDIKERIEFCAMVDGVPFYDGNIMLDDLDNENPIFYLGPNTEATIKYIVTVPSKVKLPLFYRDVVEWELTVD